MRNEKESKSAKQLSYVAPAPIRKCVCLLDAGLLFVVLPAQCEELLQTL